ncbi:MAG: hypothetical protein ACTH2Q_05745 [Propionibacteriaceae bacterium]
MTTTIGSANLRRGGRLAGLALAAGSLAVGLGGTAAHAATPTAAEIPGICVGDDQYGVGCFVPNGDHITVYDLDTDGDRIEVRWETDYGRAGVCAIRTGKNSRDCNYDMAEGRTIHYDVVAVDVDSGNRTLLDRNAARI